MDTAQFLRTILGERGYYCLVGLNTKTDKRQQRFFDSVDAVAQAAVQLDNEGYDTYFAVSTFVENDTRKADNVDQVRSFFLDIDCGEGKPYSNQQDAVNALRGFCKQNNLPRPTLIVDSGRGVHVYWVLDAPCFREEWLPAAERLKRACAQQGLRIDPTVTADAARILRVLGTHNYKTDPPRKVVLLGKVGNTVSMDSFCALLPEPVAPDLPSREYSDEDKQTMEAMLGNYTKKFTKILEKTAAGRGCAQIDKAIRRPNDMTYPEWTHVLSIAKHCEEGPQAIHIVSRGYDGYSPEETEKVAASLEYPHLCSTFEMDNPEACANCPMRNKVKSPITLGMVVREATEEDNVVEVPVEEEDHVREHGDVGEQVGDVDPTTQSRTAKYKIPSYPYPYFRGANGGVYMRIQDKDGNDDELEIYPRDLYLTQRLYDPISGPSYTIRHHTKREGIKDFIATAVELSSKEDFRKKMAFNDIFLLRSDLLMGYIGRWINFLKDTQDELEVRTQFGWTEHQESFVLGDREIFANKIERNPASSRTLQYFDYFHKRGSLDEWRKITGFYEGEGFETHQFMFGMSFGSPLWEFIPGIHGGVFHLFSQGSGHGKTTGMMGGASVWGNPAKLLLTGNDTGNSVWNRAEVFKNLPLYIDELSNIDGKAASDFLYSVTHGKQKNRMTSTGQNAERYRGMPWNLSVGTTGNSSILDRASQYRAAPKGEMQRAIEAKARALKTTPEAAVESRKLLDKLEHNCGIAGEVYIQHVIRNRLDVVKKLNDNVDKIIKDAQLAPHNRVWYNLAATTWTGLEIAKELGLIEWDLNALYAWIIYQLGRVKMDAKSLDLDIGDLVAQFYAQNSRGILRLRSQEKLEGDNSGFEQMVMPDATPYGRWVARHEYDINKLYLIATPFKEWCVQRGYNYPEVCDELRDKMHGTRAKVRIGRGTKMSLPPANCLVINWDEGEYKDVIEQEITKAYASPTEETED